MVANLKTKSRKRDRSTEEVKFISSFTGEEPVYGATLIEWRKVNLCHQNGQSYPDAVDNLRNPTSRPTQKHQTMIEMPSEWESTMKTLLILCYRKPFIGPFKNKKNSQDCIFGTVS